MSITGKDNTIDYKDIMVGDVWVCSGQSNIANAVDKEIRHFKVPSSFAGVPDEELAGGDWKVTSSETAGQFTAVGYFFARELRKHIDVPIGLLNTSWGGSRLEPWMSAEALGIDDPTKTMREFNRKRESQVQELKKNLEEQFGPIPDEDPGLVEGNSYWAGPDLDESQWSTANLPGLWEQNGCAGLDGIVWYRKSFELTQDEAEEGLEIGLAKIDDSDWTWINGQKVGGMEMAYNVTRVYQVDPGVLKTGKRDHCES